MSPGQSGVPCPASKSKGRRSWSDLSSLTALLDLSGNPGVDLVFEPADSLRADGYGAGKCRIELGGPLRVAPQFRVDGAAGKPGAGLNLFAPEDS